MPVNFTETRSIVLHNRRPIGDGNPCFIVFEAGPTHNGKDSALELAKAAAESGADAIKFQILNPDRLVSDRQQMFKYEVLVDEVSGKTETVEEPLYDILQRRYLNEIEWQEIKTFCDSHGLLFFATIGFLEELQFVEKLQCDSVKIASADINHWPLISAVAKTGMSIQLDTANATLGEVERAVDIVRQEGNERVIIHQCPSGYPARLPSINLRMIDTLRQMFDKPVAFSDHTPGADMDLAAIALGANLIEKTITKDRNTRSVEHVFSIETCELPSFIQRIRDLEVALGLNRRILSTDERKNRDRIRRSAFLKRETQAGTPIDGIDVEFRRPGDGIPPDLWEQLKGATLKHKLPEGTKLSMTDFTYV
jgi:N,N'-diacetyllegionaminate synthase